ncbi:hypothetical protein [Kitasatospora sp. NPDC091276]|uniref:hypothetical protein n=1 Tax=unclassified Kitasatospora TaxID=2633591 RepID=UPI00343206FB
MAARLTNQSVKGVAADIAHGTMKGYRQHRYRGVPLCEDCRQACRDDANTRAANKPASNRRAQAWNGGMVGESASTVRILAVPAPCSIPGCGTAAADPWPEGWEMATVDGAERQYCRPWCATYAQALADVRAIDRTEAA